MDVIFSLPALIFNGHFTPLPAGPEVDLTASISSPGSRTASLLALVSERHTNVGHRGWNSVPNRKKQHYLIFNCP